MSEKEHTVSIVRCESYEKEEVSKAFDKLLAPLGNLDFIKEGTKVAIKANLVTAIKPDKAATTHPALILELCKRLTEKGAAVTVGDSPGGPFTPLYMKGVYAATEMNRITEVGGNVNDNFSVSTCENFAEADVMHSFNYTSWLAEADVIINFAKLKTHGMMGMSAAVKNMFGAIPGTQKPEYHYRFPKSRDFASMLCDIDEYFKPVLSIIDGIVGMEGNGPTMGIPRKIGILAASPSVYDLDTVCAGVIGLTPDKVPTCQVAIERGLGSSPENIIVTGDGKDVKITDYKNIDRPNEIEFFTELVGIKGKLFNKIAKAALSTRPVLDKGCIGCEKCKKICPANAITMKKGKPKIDREKCIRCFCCQEFCPKGALKVHRPIVARILAKSK
ncbi:MAG: DUF362 domain-containing protein [Ruminococcaceae bacterium]|nr:DUF362 domain-containing protein [Oscillospiraceae bacterium]